MSEQERQAVLEAALQKWGEAAQTDMCIEEMSELTKALLKVRRLHVSMIGSEEHRSRIEAVREEIADVQIMLDQMRILYGDPVEAENGKLERPQKRLKGGGA